MNESQLEHLEECLCRVRTWQEHVITTREEYDRFITSILEGQYVEKAVSLFKVLQHKLEEAVYNYNLAIEELELAQ